MVRVDLHVHTRRYSRCASSLDPRALPAVMHARRLHGIVLAEHDETWSEEEIEELSRAAGPARRIYRGREVTTDRGHYVVIGLRGSDRLPEGMPAEALLRHAEQEGAAVILAHPHRELGGGTEPPEGIHAVEVLSTRTFGGRAAAAAVLALRRGLAFVAGSDAHTLDQVGHAFTLFPSLPTDETALAAAIHARAGTPGRPTGR